MKYESLRHEVYEANLKIVDAGLVTLTWGNASGADRDAGVFAIKPSGISYEKMQPSDMVVVSIETGEIVDGDLKPSSDTPTHLHLYREYSSIGGMVHTHSRSAVSWAQAAREIPCLGTTHADHFYGPVPVTRALRPEEVREEYERNTGRVIVERFSSQGLDPVTVPGVLVAGHGPFTWGTTASQATENAIALEAVADMALRTLLVNPDCTPIEQYLLDKHFLRKHGCGAYYGQS
jgi:L-ribulose-5-phosphate 4-epimerase